MARPAAPGDIAEWYISRVTDLEGNEIRFSYENDSNVIYLSEILYTHHPTAGAQHVVQLLYEDRPAGDSLTRYSLRIEQTIRRRLAAIVVRAEGRLYAAHTLTYRSSPYTQRSLLHQFATYGRDARLIGTSVTGRALPVKTFDYANLGRPLRDVEFETDPSASTGRQWTDFDGDGLNDYCRVTGSWPDRTAQISCRLASSGFTTEFRTHIKEFDPGYDDGRLWLDVNDDGRSDFCRIVGDPRRWIARCTMWDAQGNSRDVDSPSMSEPEQVNRAWVDVDGDRLVDFCRAIRKAPKPDQQGSSQPPGGGDPVPLPPVSQPGQLNQDLGDGALACLRFTGSAFVAGPATESDVKLGLRSGVSWVDFNGDRLVDYCRLVDRSPQCELQQEGQFPGHIAMPSVDIGYPTGRAWVDANADRLPDYCRVVGVVGNQLLRCGIADGTRIVKEWDYRVEDWGDDWSRAWTDANGDGAADYCRVSGKGDASLCSYGSGAGQFSEYRWSAPRADQPEGRRWSDVTGDNIAEYCWTAATGQRERVHCSAASLTTVDVLSSVANGLGSTTTIRYLQSTSAENTRVPLSFPIVSSLEIADGRGRTSSTQYRFEGGYWNRAAREFRGFAKAVVVGPPDSYGHQQQSETWFHQGDEVAPRADAPESVPGSMKGRPFLVSVSDTGRRTVTTTTTEYHANLLSAPRYFNPVKTVTTQSCVGDVCRETRNDYEYDAVGNLRRETQHGDLTTAADDRRTERTFLTDTSRWLIGVMQTEEIYSGTTAGEKHFGVTYDYEQEFDCTALQLVAARRPGRIGRIVSWRAAQAPAESWIGYGDAGEVRCTRDPLGNVARTEYDSHLVRPVRVISPSGLTTTTTYYGIDGVPEDDGVFGLPRTTTDSNGRETLSQYDPFGRVTLTRSADGATRRVTYENFGDVRQQFVRAVTDWGLEQREYIDGLGRVYRTRIEHQDEPAIQQLIDYDVRGNRSRVSYWHAEADERALFVMTQYDFLDRPVETRSPDGSFTRTCFGAWEAVTLERDGRLRRERFDAGGRLVQTDEYLGVYSTCEMAELPPQRSTRYAYDVMGRLASVQSPSGVVVRTGYDPLGRVVRRDDPNTGPWEYEYDLAGNLTLQRDPRGAVAEYVYDAENRAKEVTYTLNGSSRKATFEYDGDSEANLRGRLKAASWDGNTTSFEYDAVGRVRAIERLIGEAQFRTTYKHDSAGRVTAVGFPDGVAQQFVYRGRNLERVDTSSGNAVTILERDALNRVRKWRYGNGVESTFGYCPDQVVRPCAVSTKAPTGEMLQASQVVFDRDGRPVQKLDPIWGDEWFRYDSAGRLSFAQGPYGRQQWAYDEAGNITHSSRAGGLVYGDPEARDRVTSVDGRPVSYDAAGNQVERRGLQIAYDERGLPVRLARGDREVTRVYEADGSLAFQKVGPRGVLGWVKYILSFGRASSRTTWAGGEYRCERDECYRVLRVGATIIGYQRASDGKTQFVHEGVLGREEFVTDESGGVRRRSSYTPFGERYRGTGRADGVPQRIAGGEAVAGLGIITLGRRIYDPQLGRFIQPDPVAVVNGSRDALNPYAYALNDPLTFEDPDGEFAAIVIGIIVGAVLGAAAAAIQGGDLSDILRAAVIGAIAGGIGAAVGVGASALVNGGAAGAIVGSAAGGAAGNATAAFLYGGDVGRAAKTGFVAGLFGGAFGYASSYAVGGMIGGGVAAAESGGDFWQGAFQGLLGAIVAGNISSELMWEDRVDANTKFSDGDVIAFEASEGDTGNSIWSKLIGEPQSHVALKTREGIFDTVPGGARKTTESTFVGRRYVRASIGARYDMSAIRQIWNSPTPPAYGVGSGMFVCSTLVNAVTNGATLGLSPGQVVASVNGYRPGMDRVWDPRRR